MAIAQTAQKTGEQLLNEADRAAGKINENVARMAGAATHDIAENAQTRTVDLIGSLRHAIEAGADSLRADGFQTIGDMVEGFASNVGDAERRVDGFETSGLGRTVTDFIREKPLVVFGGLAAIGFVAAAAMQLSSESRKPAAPKRGHARSKRKTSKRSGAKS